MNLWNGHYETLPIYIPIFRALGVDLNSSAELYIASCILA